MKSNEEFEKKKSMIQKNIDNLTKWLEESPNNEDYIRLLAEYKEELKNYQ